MIEIFYKKDGHMMVSQSETDLNTVSYSDVVWIDLFAPSGEEKRAVEHFLGTVIQNRGQLYFVYAAYLNFPVTTRTDLYIYRMSDPLTVVGDPVCICKSEYDWEINAYHPEWKITEGPAALYRNGKIFLAYSANTVSYDYALGLLTIDDDADLMNPANWTKSAEPVFKTKAEYHVYGPGHNSFTTSPDGTEDWLVYHCMYAPVPHESRGGRRDACISKITWREDGTPDFGEPTPMYTDLPAPAGE